MELEISKDERQLTVRRIAVGKPGAKSQSKAFATLPFAVFKEGKKSFVEISTFDGKKKEDIPINIEYRFDGDTLELRGTVTVWLSGSFDLTGTWKRPGKEK
jgi:hypothetical protein